MQLMDQGALSSIITYKHSNGIKDINVIATILKDCCEALKYLHSQCIIHRDIKCANILIDNNGKICLGDLGVVGFLRECVKRYSFEGSFAWVAPEVIKNDKGYDSKVISLLLF
jgi:serine/threonine protein kinase